VHVNVVRPPDAKLVRGIHDPIVKRAGSQEFFRLAREQGMRTMFEDGLEKSIRGLTTIEELLRVTRLTPR